MQHASVCMNTSVCEARKMEITNDTTENEKHSSSFALPLITRIERLEIAMRRLEMKQSSSSPGCSSSSANNTFSPSSGLTSEHHHHQKQLPLGPDLDMVLKEVTFKGSLLERIKTLENRLFQLRLRVESDKQEAKARREQTSSSSCSFPIFTMNSQSRIAYKKRVESPNASMVINNIESQGKEQELTSCKGDDQEKSKKEIKKNRKKKNKSENGDQEKTSSRKAKKVTRDAKMENIKIPNWSHFRIIGC